MKPKNMTSLKGNFRQILNEQRLSVCPQYAQPKKPGLNDLVYATGSGITNESPV